MSLIRVSVPAGCVLLCVSCSHQVLTRSQAVPAPAAAVPARRVQNAKDAGDGDLEARALRQRLAANAQDLDARLSLARLYIRRGFPELALEHYRFATAQFPDSVPAALGLSKSLWQLGQNEEALQAVHAALSHHPGGNWELLSLEGILEDDRGQLAIAEQAYRAALALKPDQSGVYNNLGYNLLLQGKAEAAAAEFRHAIQLAPRSEIAHNNLATALAMQSRNQEALAEWKSVADNAVAHNNLATVLMGQGRYTEARAELETALMLRRNFPAAAANLRLVAQRDGLPAVSRAKQSRKDGAGPSPKKQATAAGAPVSAPPVAAADLVK